MHFNFEQDPFSFEGLSIFTYDSSPAWISWLNPETTPVQNNNGADKSEESFELDLLNMASKTSTLWRSLRTYQIYGANTNVGKTIMSTILCKAFKRQFPSQNVWYLKPVSTGRLDEADDRHIARFSLDTKTKCLFQFDEAVSPHIAARSSQVCLQLLKKNFSDHVIAPF